MTHTCTVLLEPTSDSLLFILPYMKENVDLAQTHSLSVTELAVLAQAVSLLQVSGLCLNKSDLCGLILSPLITWCLQKLQSSAAKLKGRGEELRIKGGPPADWAYSSITKRWELVPQEKCLSLVEHHAASVGILFVFSQFLLSYLDSQCTVSDSPWPTKSHCEWAPHRSSVSSTY